MALALLGGAARAIGGQMAKSGGKAMAKKMMSRGDKKQKKSVSGGSAQQKGHGANAAAGGLAPRKHQKPKTAKKGTYVSKDGVRYRRLIVDFKPGVASLTVAHVRGLEVGGIDLHVIVCLSAGLVFCVCADVDITCIDREYVPGCVLYTGIPQAKEQEEA